MRNRIFDAMALVLAGALSTATLAIVTDGKWRDALGPLFIALLLLLYGWPRRGQTFDICSLCGGVDSHRPGCRFGAGSTEDR